MSDATNNEQQEIDLTTISPELRQVIEFDENDALRLQQMADLCSLVLCSLRQKI